jgi:V/A-type H+-transporting ATPase subunit K
MSVSFCFASTEEPEDEASKNSLAQSIKYIAASLSVGLCAIATSIAQARIGAAGMGAIVEKSETTGIVIIMLAIPETMVILGFVVAAMIIIL